MNDADPKDVEKLYAERIRQKKMNELKALSELLGIPVEKLGRTIETEHPKKEDSFEYQLQEALTIRKSKDRADITFLSDKQGILAGYAPGIEKGEAERLSALVHADKNPYNIDFEMLERYGLSKFKGYNFLTKDIEGEFNLTTGFALDKRRRII